MAHSPAAAHPKSGGCRGRDVTMAAPWPSPAAAGRRVFRAVRGDPRGQAPAPPAATWSHALHRLLPHPTSPNLRCCFLGKLPEELLPPIPCGSRLCFQGNQDSDLLPEAPRLPAGGRGEVREVTEPGISGCATSIFSSLMKEERELSQREPSNSLQPVRRIASQNACLRAPWY